MDYLIKHRHRTHIREFRLRFKEWHSFLFHNLANQQRSRTNTYVLLLHSDHILTSSVRIRNSVCTCLDWYKAGSKLVRFPAWVLCFGRHVFSSGSFGCSRVETRVTSPGKLSSAIVDFVAPLRLWHSLRPPPMVGFVVRVQRAGFQVSLARVWARSYEFGSIRELQEGRARARGRASSFQLSGLDIPKGGWSNQSVGTGRSPACVQACPCKAFSCDEKNNFWSLY